MKYCIKCGHKADGNKFCIKCGASISYSGETKMKTSGYAMFKEPTVLKTAAVGKSSLKLSKKEPAKTVITTVRKTGTDYAPPKKGMSKLGVFAVAGGIVAVAITVVLILLFSGVSNNEYEYTVEEYVVAYADGDIERIISLMPEGVEEYCIDTKCGSREKLEKDIAKHMKSIDEDEDVTWEIVRDEDTADSIIESFEKDYEDIGLDIDEGRTLEVNLTFSDNRITLDMYVVKSENEWYILDPWKIQ